MALVMDMGGNWIRVALVSHEGEILWRERKRTKGQEPSPRVIARVDELLQRGMARVGDGKLAGIGMGLAGPVDPETGIMYDPPNIPSLDGVSFKELWSARVACPVLVGNDATLAALGEYRYGSGMGARTLVYLTISTGIGGGVVIDGRPLMGANGMAGELGHMTIDRNGPRCKCGNVGCLEALASGTAIAERARGRLENGEPSLMLDILSGDPSQISSETVFAAAVGGDSMARDILDDVARALGAGLVNVLHIFNPDVIVVGGGVSNHWKYLRPMVRSYIDAHAMSHVRKLGFRLSVSSLGDNIGLLGAAALVWSEARELG